MLELISYLVGGSWLSVVAVQACQNLKTSTTQKMGFTSDLRSAHE